MNKYFELLILALVVPSVIMLVFGIIIVGRQLDAGDFAYLLLLFALFIPAGAVLFLVNYAGSLRPNGEYLHSSFTIHASKQCSHK